MSPALRSKLFELAERILAEPGLVLQPAIERAAILLQSAAGKRWFQALGERLQQDPHALDGRFLPLLEQAAEHPHLNIAPLVRAFFKLATGTEGKPWQALLVVWFRGSERPEDETPGRLEPLWRALRPLLADGRLRVSEVALPTLGWFLSPAGEPVRQEVLSTLRDRLPQVNWSGVAQGIWQAAGQTWNRLKTALESQEQSPVPPDEAQGR